MSRQQSKWSVAALGRADGSSAADSSSNNDTPTGGDDPLQQHRREIDALDAELLRLLNQRARIANDLASIKKSSGLPVYDGQREQQILDRMGEETQGPLGPESIIEIFRCIIRESRRVEETSMRELENNYFKQEKHDGHQHGSRRVRG